MGNGYVKSSFQRAAHEKVSLNDLHKDEAHVDYKFNYDGLCSTIFLFFSPPDTSKLHCSSILSNLLSLPIVDASNTMSHNPICTNTLSEDVLKLNIHNGYIVINSVMDFDVLSEFIHATATTNKIAIFLSGDNKVRHIYSFIFIHLFY